MRKITSLLMLLCMFVGTAWAQWSGKSIATLSTTPATELKDGYYVIYNNGRGTFMNSEGALGQVRVTWPTSETKSGVEALASDEELTNAEGQKVKTGYVFYVNVDGSTLSLQSGYNDFVQVLTSNVGAKFVENEGFWEYAVKEGGFVFMKNPTTNTGLDCNGWSASDHSYSDVAGWDADGTQNTAGNQSWTFYEATLEDVGVVDITYNYYDGSKKITSVTKNNVTVGGAYPEANDVPAYVSVTGVPEGVVSAAGEYDLQCSLSESFPFKNNFGLTLNEGKRWLIGNGTSTELTLTGLSVANLESADTYTWTLEGNWYEGFNFKHKGTNKYLASEAETPIEGTKTVLQETADGKAMFDIVLNAGKYYIKFHGSEYSYIQQYGGGDSSNLSFWLSNSNIGDKGSMFAVQEVNFETLLNNFKTENAPIAGYVGGYDATAEEINNLTLQTVAEFVANTDTVEFVDGLYRIQNILRKQMVGFNGTDRVKGKIGKTDVSQIWHIKTVGDSIVLMNLNAGAYMKAPNAGNDLVTEAEAAKYKLSRLGCAQYNLKVGGTNLVIYGGGSLGGWSDNGLNSDGAWYIIPATDIEVVVDEAGYATTYLPFAVTLPEGVKAYAVDAVEGEAAKLAEKADIPANTAAILAGEGTHTLAIAATAASDWTGNLLKGSNVPANVAEKAYVLAMPEGESVGFYAAKFNVSTDATNDGEEGAEDDTFEAFVNNANKAYLPASAVASGARFISFDFGTETAIENIEGAEVENAVVYDLSGRRVQKAQKGVFIVNGKVVIK